jgi:multiple sugar transport system permease protein
LDVLTGHLGGVGDFSMFDTIRSGQHEGIMVARAGQRRWADIRHAAFGYGLLAPAICVILGLNLYPTINGILTSFTDQSLLNPNAWQGVGWQNYQRLLADPVFQISFLHSLVLTISAVVLQVVLGLGMAHLLIRQVPGIQWFRAVAMVTWVLPIITAVVMFRFLTLPNIGLVNIILAALGFGSLARNWFGDPAFAFLLILVMHLWRNVPFYGIAFMAAIQAIPQDLYEAATIDGASAWKRFWHITLPNLRYIILVMVVLHVTFTLNNFDFVYLSTGGGPVDATEVLATYIYKQAWSGYVLGYASAGGVIMLVTLVLLVVLSWRLIGGFSEK